MKKILVILMVVAMLLAFSGIALAQQSGTVGATATLRDTKGTVVGTATFTDQGDNGVLVTVHMNGNLKVTGAHGIHIDDVGTCTPTFDAAGKHFNPIGRVHPGHAGDLPNIVMQANGTADYVVSSNRFTLTPGGLSIFDFNGSSLVVDANPDDMTHGAVVSGGARIACGVIVAANGLSTNGTMTGTTASASTTGSTVVTRSNTVTSTAGVTNTTGTPTTLPVTGGESNGLPAVVVLMLGAILFASGYLLRRRAQAQ